MSVAPKSERESLGRAELEAAYTRALGHLRDEQLPNGALAGECVWNPMLACQWVIVMRILGRPISERRKATVVLALRDQVRPDGGWGMHPDSESYLFHTLLGYVALRLVDVPADDPLAANALAWIRNAGGPYKSPTWGRIWLALLGMYPWSHIQPILPELWLLPDRAPMHPRRLYCHMRLIYLGLSYAYGARIRAEEGPDLRAIRRELYPEGYRESEFAPFKWEIADTDLYEEPGTGLTSLFEFARKAERFAPKMLRRRALERAMEHIHFEFRSTGYVCLSPVNGMLFCLALWDRDHAHPELDRAVEGIEYWVWEDDQEGLRICGARSDIWDTSFALQALCEGPRTELARELAADACAWLPIAQLQADIPGGNQHYREPARGGWGFANEKHPWPVSDCTAEALEALCHCEEAGLSKAQDHLSLQRKLHAVEFVLLRQNDDGGFGSYEARRGSMVLKRFNPAEIYGNCMLEYSYAECTASCIRGLAFAREHLDERMPAELRERVNDSIRRGVEALLEQQDSNGAWPGFWGVNFTYGTFFVVGGLLAAGLDPEHLAIRRAVRWLVAHQREDGGWGEAYQGNLHGEDVPLPDDEPSLVVQTAWALMTLLEAAPQSAQDSIARGLEYLVQRQGSNGAWPPERATGVFFNTAVLDYRLYRQVFPTWALARALGTESPA